MMQSFYAHGKFLLSGEYAILHGAKGLAIPLNKGQKLNFYKSPKKLHHPIIKWEAYDWENKLWLNCTFDKKTFEPLTKNETTAKSSATLKTLFQGINPAFFEDDVDYFFQTHLEFNHLWGWGSSSTLVSLLAQCTDTNPYHLYAKTFKGSGYDLACATAQTAITYQLDTTKIPLVNSLDFNPNFKDKLFFAYLGKKANSLKSIRNYAAPSAQLIKDISAITEKLIAAQNDMKAFCELIELHELAMSSYLNMPTLKAQGLIPEDIGAKSLGAWGGDFIMLIGDAHQIKKLNFAPIFNWNEIVLGA